MQNITLAQNKVGLAQLIASPVSSFLPEIIRTSFKPNHITHVYTMPIQIFAPSPAAPTVARPRDDSDDVLPP